MISNHEIIVSDQVLDGLKRAADPFVETTPDAVIRKLLAFWDARGGSVASRTKAIATPASPQRVFSGAALPNLRHTKVTLAYVNGIPLKDPSWNRLVYETVGYARGLVPNFRELKAISFVNLVEGRKQDQGYHFLSDVGLSVQGQDANGAWRTVSHLASRLGFIVEVDFIWRDKEGSERRGEVGHLSAGHAK